MCSKEQGFYQSSFDDGDTDGGSRAGYECPGCGQCDCTGCGNPPIERTEDKNER